MEGESTRSVTQLQSFSRIRRKQSITDSINNKKARIGPGLGRKDSESWFQLFGICVQNRSKHNPKNRQLFIRQHLQEVESRLARRTGCETGISRVFEADRSRAILHKK